MKKSEKFELSQKAREARNRYAREYRKKNPEKVKRYFAGYWEKKAMNEISNGDEY